MNINQRYSNPSTSVDITRPVIIGQGQPTNIQWKGQCTITRHSPNPNDKDTRNIDITFTANFETGKINAKASQKYFGEDVIIDAHFLMLGDISGNLHGTVTINTPAPIVCNIVSGDAGKEGTVAAFDSLDVVSGKGNKDSAGNSYAGTFESYSNN